MLELGTPACDKHGRSPRYQGKEITIQGTTFILARWNLKTLRATAPFRKAIREAKDPDSDEVYANNLKVIALALKMNYPDVTEDDIEEQLTIIDVQEIGEALAEVNARRTAEGEAKGAKMTTIPTNGTISLSSSPEPGVGNGTS